MAYEVIDNIQQVNFQINRVLTYGAMACDYTEVVAKLSMVKNMEEWFPAWKDIGDSADEDL